jgi:hypothetical protein
MIEPMHLNDLANIGQIVGAIAVVISLIYVALQIRQNTNAIRAATAQSVHEHFANWYNSFARDASLSQIAINGLWIVIGGGQGALRGGVHGVPLLFSKRVLEMATGALGTIALVRLGTGHYESGLRTGRQSVLERTLLSLRRRIPSLCRRRFNDPASGSKADGRIQHRAAATVTG